MVSSGLLFSPGLRTKAGQPVEEKYKVKTAKNTRGKKSLRICGEKSFRICGEKSYRIHIWCCESPILPRPP